MDTTQFLVAALWRLLGVSEAILLAPRFAVALWDWSVIFQASLTKLREITMRPSSLMCGVCALALLSSIPSSGIAQSTDRLSTGIQAQVAVYRISVDARGVLRIAVPPGSSGSILIDGQRVLELNGQGGGVVEAMTTVDPGLHVVELRGALAADPGRISLARPGGAAEALSDAGSAETVSATASETSSGGQPIMSFGQRGASGSGGMRLSGLANDDGSGATG
ncbi:MAG: hypothetical protein AAFP67_13040, partial [Pseudomonadota bacterium]